MSSADIVLRDIPYTDEQRGASYLEVRESLSREFLQIINNSFEKLLNFAPFQKSYITGSLLVVPLAGRKVEEKYKMRVRQGIVSGKNSELLQQMYGIMRNSQNYPENLRTALKEAIDLVKLLEEQPHKTQNLEQNSQYSDRYYVLPLFAVISAEAIAKYFTSQEVEPEDQRFKEILTYYIRSIYPVSNILPIGHEYKDFPFLVFRSYSLNEMRSKMFTDKYLLTSNELNILNLILTR